MPSAAMSSVKKLCICAVCIALCYALPPAFHAVGLASALSPMHFPILLCGLLCGWPYGLACGVLGPLLSCVLASMPPVAKLPYMLPELAAYGLFCGLLMKFIRTGRTPADLYLSLVPSMVLGRIVAGAARGLYFMATAQEYTLALWAAGYFVESAPAIAAQLIVVPPLALALMKARLIPARYPAPQAEKRNAGPF